MLEATNQSASRDAGTTPAREWIIGNSPLGETLHVEFRCGQCELGGSVRIAPSGPRYSLAGEELPPPTQRSKQMRIYSRRILARMLLTNATSSTLSQEGSWPETSSTRAEGKGPHS